MIFTAGYGLFLLSFFSAVYLILATKKQQRITFSR